MLPDDSLQGFAAHDRGGLNAMQVRVNAVDAQAKRTDLQSSDSDPLMLVAALRAPRRQTASRGEVAEALCVVPKRLTFSDRQRRQTTHNLNKLKHRNSRRSSQPFELLCEVA
jgi:hypothetical protein